VVELVPKVDLVGYGGKAEKSYHEGLGGVAPYDVCTGRNLEVSRRRREMKCRPLKERKVYNRTARKASNETKV
jgi:hypothetical protein